MLIHWVKKAEITHIKTLTTTWFEHATFWSGVRRATIAPRRLGQIAPLEGMPSSDFVDCIIWNGGLVLWGNVPSDNAPSSALTFEDLHLVAVTFNWKLPTSKKSHFLDGFSSGFRLPYQFCYTHRHNFNSFGNFRVCSIQICPLYAYPSFRAWVTGRLLGARFSSRRWNTAPKP